MRRKLTNSEFALLRQNKKLGRKFVLPVRVAEEETPDQKKVWFSGVDPALIKTSKSDESSQKTLVKEDSFEGLTRRVAIDCEFVGVGYDAKDDCLARVSIVNQFGHVLMDEFVLPREKVVDYRTKYSGIRPADLHPSKAMDFDTVHRKVAEFIQDRILVGHAVQNDLSVLLLSHPRRDIRDTSRYKPFRTLFSGRTPSLRQLTKRVLNIDVQEDEHDSVEDARATMRLYMSVKTIWEAMVSCKNKDRVAKLKQSIPCGSEEQLKPKVILTKHQRFALNRMRRKQFNPKSKTK